MFQVALPNKWSGKIMVGGCGPSFFSFKTFKYYTRKKRAVDPSQHTRNICVYIPTIVGEGAVY